MVSMTLNDLQTRVNVIHFGINRFLEYDFLYAVNSNFCSGTHRLDTVHIRDKRQTTDVRTAVQVWQPCPLWEPSPSHPHIIVD